MLYRIYLALILVLVALLFASTLCFAQDVRVADVVFVDERHGWVSATEPAAIFRTSDGGATWQKFSFPSEAGLYRLHFLDTQTGVALEIDEDGTTWVYRTENAGETWVKVAAIRAPHGASLVDLVATSHTDVLVVGEESGTGYVAQILGPRGTLQVRDDLPVDLPRESNTAGIFGDGAGHLWIVGKQLILHSSDNGKTWENQFANTDPTIDLAISGWALPGGHAWAAVANFEIYRTDDFGKHWTRALTTVGKDDINFDSISFSTPETGCAIGNSPFIYCTRDGGLTWVKTKAFPNYVRDSSRTRLFLFPSSHGWASINEALYKTSDGGRSFEEVLSHSAPKEANLPGEFQALQMSINGPTRLDYDQQGFLYIVESIQNRLLRLNLQHSSIKTVLDYRDATGPDSAWITSVAEDHGGNVLIGDMHGRLRRLDSRTGELAELVSQTPDSAPHVLDQPVAMVVDAQGNVLIADQQQHKLFRWRPQTGLETVAGTGIGKFSGDGGSARAATLHFPSGVSVSKAGDIFIADYENCRIRKIDHRTEIITTIAGTGECASAGDGGPAKTAALNFPAALVADKKGNLFFAEGATARVRRIDRRGIITTYAGTGEKGFSGDGGPATQARLNNPSGLAIDESGNLYIADFVNNRVRRVDVQTHVITTVAGNGRPDRVDIQL